MTQKVEHLSAIIDFSKKSNIFTGQYMKTRMISDNHPDGQDDGPGPGPLGTWPTGALAHLSKMMARMMRLPYPG